MYIKQVIIQGFKSYRDQTVVEPFDKRHNVVVGRNGSGKSNFFYAIQFVLSDEYSQLRSDIRQSLLHEGTGSRVVSAFVEIIFDNSDSRMPIDSDEVFLRRVIGAKKDQYFLNRKIVPRSEVMNLLESAGFSNSNPYYIVKQGKINQIALAPDSYRLKLLREVAGTRVYDERREQSMAILNDAETKVAKIVEFLDTIEERLSTLNEEKEELKQYQKWDKIRRALDYVIYEKELAANKKSLDDLETERKQSGEEQAKFASDLKEAKQNIVQYTRNVKEIKKELATINEEIDTLSTKSQQLFKDKTKLNLVIKDLTDEVNGDSKSRARAEAELQKLMKTIAEKEAELAKLKPHYEELKKREEECTRELNWREQKRKDLYAKQGRSNQFSSKADRDRWIQTELKSLNRQIKDKRDHQNRLSDDLISDSRKKVQLEEKIQRQTNEIEIQRITIDDLNKNLYELKKRKDRLQSDRNDLCRRENNIHENLASLKGDLAKADQQLRSLAGKPILNGRDSVRTVLETFRSRGGAVAQISDMYYGLIIENFNCEKAIYTAVEVTAGNRLFHHIVESDQVGTQILKEMNRQGLPGEVTFMPLNRLQARVPVYPSDNNAIPMVSKLNYDQRFDLPMRYLFGKTLICRNLECATELARSTGLDCVTLEGDQVSSKGSLTGGYFNVTRSRLETQKNRNEFIQQINATEKSLTEIRDQLKTVETEINTVVSEMQKIETKTNYAKNTFDKLRGEIRLIREEIGNIDKYRNAKERSLEQCKANLEAMETTKSNLESELHQELMSQLSVADQAEVDSLNDDIQRLTIENKQAFSERMKLEGEKNKLEQILTNNLIRRRDELQHALQEITLEDRKHQLKKSKAEIEETERNIKAVDKQIKELTEKADAVSSKLKKAQSTLDNWVEKDKKIQSVISDDAKLLEKIASKQNLLEQKINACVEKINALGAFPASELYNTYKSMSNSKLFKELEKANNELKKYTHVNKKALDQYVSFSDHKEKLHQRKAELDRGEEKIRELLAMLESRKMEAIQFTFKQVSKFFTDVFQKLVPQGSAYLVMRTSKEDPGHAITPDEKHSDSFTGVGIRVSFNNGGEMREMNQLSGGQKSLIALTLIFAIQKCDPAPFYLFDEIDQALDAQHRKAVADMIHELSSEAQFITTTFRPELLEYAHKFYGVKFRNKVSHVECVSKEVARDFVEDDTTHA